MAIPSKSKIFEHWMDWLDKKGFDWGEPSCWACGKHWEDKYDIKNPAATRKEIIKNWDRVPLQRCHIIAKQFGGSDEPSNLFLMCSDCHDKAPNTLSVDAFFLWVENQNWYTNLQNEVTQAINTFGLQDRIVEMTELLSNEKTRKEISKSLGIHMNQRGKGTEITIPTYMATLYDNLSKQDRAKESQK